MENNVKKCFVCRGRGWIVYEDSFHKPKDDCWKCLGSGEKK